MKELKTTLLVVTVIFFGDALMAQESSLELATERGCFICHTIHVDPAVDRPLAPSYQEIAEQYRNDEQALQYLVNRILHGTLYTEQNWSGGISMRFMPPNVNVDRVEAAELANWILTLPEDKALRHRLANHESMLILSARSGCPACHLMDASPDSRLMPLAPAFREVARRYRDDAEAERKIIRSIIHGTRSATKIWPHVNMQFMPPNVGLVRTDAESLAHWILGLK